MIACNSSDFRPTRVSTSTPRSRKMASAAGLSWSAISTLGMVAPISRRLRGSAEPLPGPGEGPVEPGQEGLDVVGLDCGPAPDAQPRRRVAVALDVVGRALVGQQLGQVLDEGLLAILGQGGERGVGDGKADRGRRAQGGRSCQELDPWGPLDPGCHGRKTALTTGDKGRQAADTLGPA